MNFHILTLFPEMVVQGLSTSILGKAVEASHISINAVNIRDYTLDKHKKVDDYPYGGGAGMLMQAQPVYDAYKSVEKKITERNGNEGKKPRVIFLTPQGKTFHQEMAEEFAREENLIFLCGHYEGIDERVLEEIVTDEVSIGDYVLTGGELAAMVMIDSISRLVPGVLNNEESAHTESFHNHLLEYPQYSRPEVWMDKAVPGVLLSGDHKKINAWRLEQAKERTKRKRPDLYAIYEEYQQAIATLMKNKLIHMDMIELLRLGESKMIYHGEHGVLLLAKKCRVAFLSCKSAMAGCQILRELSDKVWESFDLLVAHQEVMYQPLGEEFGLIQGKPCKQAVYTRGVTLPVSKELEIRKLTEEYVEVIRENTTSMYGEEYIRERVQAGVMYGAFVEGELAGFIGEHEEGSMGMLTVLPQYQRKGIATSLEAFCINRMLREGRVPFAHIFVDNEESLRLQERLGLRISKETFCWFGKK